MIKVLFAHVHFFHEPINLAMLAKKQKIMKITNAV